MASIDTQPFEEPSGEQERAGIRSWDKPKAAYEVFMEEEGIPVYTGIGFNNVRELDLGDWSRLGARGAYLYLDGLEGIKGMYVLEVPGGGVTNVERHLYHQFYLVLEGSGTTESWREGSGKQIFEWQPGSLFYLPPNVNHRLVNAQNKRVLILAATNAPPLWNLLRNREFILGNDFNFSEYYEPDDDFYRFNDELYQWRVNHRATQRTNFFPDIIKAELPLDNQRVPGYRRIQPAFRGFDDDLCGFISQFPSGRYSRAHYHPAGAVLVCLGGKGYTYNWPRELGTTPWKDGNGDQVRYLEYVQGGLVAAAPGGGNWFHQHFPTGVADLRVINFWGGPQSAPVSSNRNEVTGMSSNLNLREGGSSIAYSEEDPYVRETHEAALAAEGAQSLMPPELYADD
jgi:quercetin dioxygenase-like cupin family protein